MNILCDRLFNKSVEKHDIRKALDEWQYTDECWELDYDEECELCGQSNLRNKFRIKNTLNNETLDIGSVCIIKFEIKVQNNGAVITDPKVVGQQLNKDIATVRAKNIEKHVRAAFKSLKAQIHQSKHHIVDSLEQAVFDKGLSPNQLDMLYSWFDKHDVMYNTCHFKVRLGKTKFKEQLHPYLVNYSKILESLTPAQRKKFLL